jgi:hypothetical protein
MTERTRNQQIAELILDQTYEERIDLVGFLAMAATQLVEDGSPSSDLDTPYFASLLASWAQAEEVENDNIG